MVVVVYMGLLDTIRAPHAVPDAGQLLPVLWLIFLLTPRLQAYWERLPSARRVVCRAGATRCVARYRCRVDMGAPMSAASALQAPAARPVLRSYRTGRGLRRLLDDQAADHVFRSSPACRPAETGREAAILGQQRCLA